MSVIIQRKVRMALSVAGMLCALFFLCWSSWPGTANKPGNSPQADPGIEPEAGLLAAAESGDLIALGYYLGRTSKINTTDKALCSALMLALQNKHNQIVQYLLQHGADPALEDSLGKFALKIAAGNSNLEGIKILLKHNADVDQGANRGDTALLAACRKGDNAVIELLLRNQAALWPGRAAGQGALVSCLRNYHTASARLLLSYGADCNEQDENGNNVLMLAIKSGDAELVRCILQDHPVDINWRNKAGESAFDLAQKSRNQAIIKLVSKQ